MPRWLIPASAVFLLAPTLLYGEPAPEGAASAQQATANASASPLPQFGRQLCGAAPSMMAPYAFDQASATWPFREIAWRLSEICAPGEPIAISTRPGLAVGKPGFINMLSWATVSLLQDGRSQSDIRQGVTLEVFGEGWSMGPLNAHETRHGRRTGGHQVHHSLVDAR